MKLIWFYLSLILIPIYVAVEGRYTNDWPKYELDADQNLDLHQFIKLSAPNKHGHEQDSIEDNNSYNEYADLLVDEDIKSIMISNDKLVKHLADLVSFTGQAIDSGDNQDDDDDETEDGDDEEKEEDTTRLTVADQTMGKSVTTHSDDGQNEDQEQEITLDRRQVAVKNKSRKAGQERKIGSDDDGIMSNNVMMETEDDERGGVDESLDYNLNLLEDLVRKTFEDYARKSGTSFLLDQTKPTHTTETTTTTSYQINRTISTEPNQSSSSTTTENGSRARRSSKLRRRFTVRPVNQQTATEHFDVSRGVVGERIRSEEDDDVDESGPFSRRRKERGGYKDGIENGAPYQNPPLFKNNNQNNEELSSASSTAQSYSERRVGVPELPDTRENSIKENINDRLCIDETDNNDNSNYNNDNFQQYKNCLDMPECESGGKCITETKWFIPHPNQNFDLEYLTRPRCQCPIGRGGFSCQKRK